jgi:hypothetical protein
LKKELHALQRIQCLDKAGIVIEEGAVGNPSKALAKFCQFDVGKRCPHGFGCIDTAERPHAIDSLRPALRTIERGLQIGIADRGFADELVIILCRDAVVNDGVSEFSLHFVAMPW